MMWEYMDHGAPSHWLNQNILWKKSKSEKDKGGEDSQKSVGSFDDYSALSSVFVMAISHS